MKSLLLAMMCVFGCVAFHDEEVEVPNRAPVAEVVVEVKQPIRTVAELDAWAETARYNVYNK